MGFQSDMKCNYFISQIIRKSLVQVNVVFSVSELATIFSLIHQWSIVYNENEIQY